MAARRGRGRSFRGADKKLYQWFGIQVTDIVVDSDAIDFFQVIQGNSSVTERSKGTIVRSLASITIASSNATRDPNQTLSLILQKSELIPSTGTATNVLDPASTDAFELGNADVMGWWTLPVPQTTGSATNSVFQTTNFEFKAKRKLSLKTNSIGWGISGFDTVDLKFTGVMRSLMQY